jgi:hypothetical protein
MRFGGKMHNAGREKFQVADGARNVDHAREVHRFSVVF